MHGGSFVLARLCGSRAPHTLARRKDIPCRPAKGKGWSPRAPSDQRRHGRPTGTMPRGVQRMELRGVFTRPCPSLPPSHGTTMTFPSSGLGFSGARVGVRIGTVTERRRSNARAGRIIGAQTLGGCRRGSHEVIQALSSRSRAKKTDLQLMRGIQSQQGRRLEGPAHPSPDCPPQAIGGLPPRPCMDQHKTRSSELVASLVVSTNGSQPAWFTAPVDSPVVEGSKAAPAGTLVKRVGGPIDLAIPAGQHQRIARVNQPRNGQCKLSEPSGTLRGSALGGQAGRPRKGPWLGQHRRLRSL